jgi:hypothetical protein
MTPRMRAFVNVVTHHSSHRACKAAEGQLRKANHERLRLCELSHGQWLPPKTLTWSCLSQRNCKPLGRDEKKAMNDKVPSQLGSRIPPTHHPRVSGVHREAAPPRATRGVFPFRGQISVSSPSPLGSHLSLPPLTGAQRTPRGRRVRGRSRHGRVGARTIHPNSVDLVSHLPHLAESDRFNKDSAYAEKLEQKARREVHNTLHTPRAQSSGVRPMYCEPSL